MSNSCLANYPTNLTNDVPLSLFNQDFSLLDSLAVSGLLPHPLALREHSCYYVHMFARSHVNHTPMRAPHPSLHLYQKCPGFVPISLSLVSARHHFSPNLKHNPMLPNYGKLQNVTECDSFSTLRPACQCPAHCPPRPAPGLRDLSHKRLKVPQNCLIFVSWTSQTRLTTPGSQLRNETI